MVLLINQKIQHKYYSRTLDNAQVPVYMIEYENGPIGIVQYKLENNNDKIIYGLNGDNIYELDIFIGELDYQNKGLGKICINMITNYLFENKGINKLIEKCEYNKEDNNKFYNNLYDEINSLINEKKDMSYLFTEIEGEKIIDKLFTKFNDKLDIGIIIKFITLFNEIKEGKNYLFGENGKFLELFEKLEDNEKNFNNFFNYFL